MTDVNNKSRTTGEIRPTNLDRYVHISIHPSIHPRTFFPRASISAFFRLPPLLSVAVYASAVSKLVSPPRVTRLKPA